MTKFPNVITQCHTYGQLKKDAIQTAGKAKIYNEPEIRKPLRKSNVFFGAVFFVILIPITNPIHNRILKNININP